MRKMLLLLVIAPLIFGCEQRDRRDERRDVDNTGRNVRDRETGALTPGMQNENEMDLRLTQEVRRAIVSDDSLSPNAKNIKIITRNSVVTLRGVLDNQDEKRAIASKIREIRGVRHVEDLTEVKNNR